MQKGVAHEYDKMNFYLKQLPFVPAFGLFATKSTAIWCKTECVLMLNAVRFDAKCSAFWCKTQGKMLLNAVQNAAKSKAIKHTYPLQWYKYNLFES